MYAWHDCKREYKKTRKVIHAIIIHECVIIVDDSSNFAQNFALTNFNSFLPLSLRGTKLFALFC
jgi:hypothetical protein